MLSDSKHCHNQTITRNEASALSSLSQIFNAELTFEATTGNGRYGTLEALATAGFINHALATGQREGYDFELKIQRQTSPTTPSSYLLTATPVKYGKTGCHSFYANELALIHESDPVTALPTRQPVILEGGGITDNEASAVITLRTMFSAAITFQSTSGNGNYGALTTLGQMNMLDCIRSSGLKDGYEFKIRIEQLSSESAASFELTATPVKYGQTGLKSFYLNESGEIRAADRKGAQATFNDETLQE